MDTRTFVLQNKLSLTVPATAVKVLDVQPTGKGAFVGHVLINAGALGQLRGRLDPRLLDGTDRDLDDATRWLTQPVFCGTDPVPVVSLTRVAPASGDDGGSSPAPAPGGPGLDLK
jgi:hypothetical protein